MLHALYITAFAILAVLAISNLIRNFMLLGAEARRPAGSPFAGGNSQPPGTRPVPHPEMLDETGRVVDEPLLVMRSISLEDARERLDALYDGPSDAHDKSSDED